jgi:hypothetical protein
MSEVFGEILRSAQDNKIFTGGFVKASQSKHDGDRFNVCRSGGGRFDDCDAG